MKGRIVSIYDLNTMLLVKTLSIFWVIQVFCVRINSQAIRISMAKATLYASPFKTIFTTDPFSSPWGVLFSKHSIFHKLFGKTHTKILFFTCSDDKQDEVRNDQINPLCTRFQIVRCATRSKCFLAAEGITLSIDDTFSFQLALLVTFRYISNKRKSHTLLNNREA